MTMVVTLVLADAIGHDRGVGGMHFNPCTLPLIPLKGSLAIAILQLLEEWWLVAAVRSAIGQCRIGS